MNNSPRYLNVGTTLQRVTIDGYSRRVSHPVPLTRDQHKLAILRDYVKFDFTVTSGIIKIA